ncbi:MAG: VCBS repeat-containing protein, partial [Gammaproteobacteria bacterium]
MSFYSGRLLMMSMRECAGAQSPCHDATNFTYADDLIGSSSNFTVSQITGLSLASNSDQSTAPPRSFHSIGDLDGDGTRELAISTTDSAGTHTYLAQFGPNRSASALGAVVDLSNTAFSIEPTAYVDIDGDGRAKLIQYGGTTLSFGVWNLARGTPIPANGTFSSLFTTVNSNIPGNITGEIYPGDFDGDGRIDIALVRSDTVNCSNTPGNRGL